MASKKYILVVALIVLIQSVGLAQTDWGWDWKDTSKISVKNLPQHNEFLNNQFPYPAMPRNQWELSIGLGESHIIGDLPYTNPGIGGSISLRKALNHTFSIRAGYYGSLNRGGANVLNVALGAHNNYKNNSHMGGIDIIASLNPASYYRGNPKTNVYILAGYNFIAARILYKDNLGPAGAQPDGYNQFYGQDSRGFLLANTQHGLIGTMGTKGLNNRGGLALLSGVSVGAGIAFKVTNSFNIGFEERLVMTPYDYLDAYSSGQSNYINPATSAGAVSDNRNDMYSYTAVKLNFNLGNTSKKVQPLWWINPNNYVYNELNMPKHMKLPKVVLPDADGDGVTDQFDLEPNTPKGCPVDSHGVSKDTDGDGVPDCRDKEILTLLKCFPVNSDGVGTCPEPACCKEIRDMLANQKPVEKAPECNVSNLPSVQFKGNAKLSKAAETVLANAAATIKANPNCKVKVIGYGTASKAAQQLSWERVNAVIKYLVEKQGISESRLLFQYGNDGDSNTVDLQGTMDSGPNTVPAPHPNLKSN